RFLKDIADAAALRRQEDAALRVEKRHIAERDAPTLGAAEPGYGREQRRLARAGRANDAGDAVARLEGGIERKRIKPVMDFGLERHAHCAAPPMRRRM